MFAEEGKRGWKGLKNMNSSNFHGGGVAVGGKKKGKLLFKKWGKGLKKVYVFGL